MIYDYIIIGSGGAGLFSALSIEDNKKVLVLTKGLKEKNNTYYAQGGIATSVSKEGIASHIEDTLKAGIGKCNKKAVETLCSKSIEIIDELISLGFQFDRDSDGNLMYTKESAHSINRILHSDGDATGRELHGFLLKLVEKKKNVTILDDSLVTDMLLKDDICHGVTAFVDDKFENFYAKYIFITTGGVGSIFKYHTNSKGVDGELHGVCIKNKIELENMYLMQFHPTVFVENRYARKLLLSEALRGEGAYVLDDDGNRFLFDYSKDGELSTRAVTSRAIYDFEQNKKKRAYLGFENFSQKFFETRFPNIYHALKKFGYNVPKDKIPISPAFHYTIGGIKVDIDGVVDGYKNLYAIGEVASNGVHGANRLASNSLLELFVFSKMAVAHSQNLNLKHKIDEFDTKEFVLFKKQDKILKDDLRLLMWQKVGIIRNDEELLEAKEQIKSMLKKDIGYMLELKLLVSLNIIESAITNPSLGAHYKI
jgi:L-aspartate oxidase